MKHTMATVIYFGKCKLLQNMSHAIVSPQLLCHVLPKQPVINTPAGHQDDENLLASLNL